MKVAALSVRPYAAMLFLFGLATLVALILVLPADAAVISETYYFSEPTLESRDGYTYVRIEGLPAIANPGEPLLPVRGAQLLIPPGEEVIGIEVIPGTREVLSGSYLIAPAQEEHPLSLPGPFEPTPPNSRIYGLSTPFPSTNGIHVTTERIRGYDIAFARLYPVEYTPATGEIAYYESLEIRVQTAPSMEVLDRQGHMFRSDARTLERVAGLIDNPGAEFAYVDRLNSHKTGERNGDTYPYLIITDDPYVSILQDLADFKSVKGVKAKIVRVDSLTANVGGDDAQDKIRNYIIEAYQTMGTEYVLLAGDDEIIPHRGLYAVGSEADYDIPADLYYGGLDGNWNTDDDSRWGEPAEADLIPEVHVGRAPMDNTTEATHFVTKTIAYQLTPVAAECENTLFVGELLWDNPLTFGGDYMEEIRLGSSANGYTTVGFPDPAVCDTLYDRGPANPEWDKNDLIPLMNGGVNQLHHLGHASNTYGLRMVNSDVQTRFTNDGVTHGYFIIYTQGCYCNAFDNRTSGYSYTEDALSEYFLGIENGAVAFIGNTRYGWGAQGSTDGASQRYHRQYVDAVFDEGMYIIGAANDDSKVDNIFSVDSGVNRWCYYEINLMGDPELPIWTTIPEALTLTHDGNCWVGQNEYEVVVASARGPLEDALACLHTDDGDVYAIGATDADGRVYLDPSATGAGAATLTVYAHNYIISEEPVTIQTSQDPYVIWTSTTIDDDGGGLSSGDGDGVIEAGETVELTVELENVGQNPVSGVWATLSSADAFVQVTSDTSVYGTLPGGGSESGNPVFVVEIDAHCPDTHEMTFELTINNAKSHGVRHKTFVVGAPRLVMLSFEVSDVASGNGDGCLQRMEIADLTVTIENAGSDPALDVVGTLLAGDPNVTFVTGTDGIASLGIGSTTDLAFEIQVNEDCPLPWALEIPVELSATTGEIRNEPTEAWVPGPLSTDFEAGVVGHWTHMACTQGYVDEWHLTDAKSHDEGTYSWKCGKPAGGGDYASYADGGLISPGVCLSGSDTLEFWQRIRAEDDVNNTAWDGAFVEISQNGGETWQQITPIGGYPYTIIDNEASPFAPGTPCWSGVQVWELAEFDLSGLTGPAHFRFRFGSDGYVAAAGWWIDEVVLRTESMTDTRNEIVLLSNGPMDFALSQNHPNPFNPVTTVRFAVPQESRVSIAVYNVLGQQVATLVDDVTAAGYHEVTWDGRDRQGQAAASGVYFCRMKADNFTSTRRMVLMK